MVDEILLSAGIDIGTTTTHLIISEIGICTEGGFGCVPKAKITNKKIIYKSPVYFTPLSNDGGIDANAVAEIITNEYRIAGIDRSLLNSGAVIITGESSKKENAEAVLHTISELSGNFVVAQAGAELESFLAGKGAGADVISADTGKTVANIDIGGGTTNISFFENGECADDCCLNIGGRLVKYDGDSEIISDTIKPLYDKSKNIDDLCAKMADVIFDIIHGKGADEYLITDHLPKGNTKPQIITFSGGVGECIYNNYDSKSFNDIGVILAKAVKERFKAFEGEIIKPSNPIRATVIGAGNFSMEISGSTIHFAEKTKLPIKNLECIKDFDKISDRPCAICPSTDKSPDFVSINNLAEKINNSCKNLIKNNIPIVVITKYDVSKALGICLKRKLPKDYPFICADGIDCSRGDYIDIGSPVANGKAVPVVVKTLVFGG